MKINRQFQDLHTGSGEVDWSSEAAGRADVACSTISCQVFNIMGDLDYGSVYNLPIGSTSIFQALTGMIESSCVTAAL